MFWSFRMFQSEAALARCALFPIVAPVAQQLHTPDVSSGTEGLEHVSGARAARDLGLYLCHAAVDSRARANEASRGRKSNFRVPEFPRFRAPTGDADLLPRQAPLLTAAAPCAPDERKAFRNFRMFRNEAALARCALFPIVAPVAQQLHSADVSSGTEGLEHVSGGVPHGTWACTSVTQRWARGPERTRPRGGENRISEFFSPCFSPTARFAHDVGCKAQRARLRSVPRFRAPTGDAESFAAASSAADGGRALRAVSAG